MPLGCHQKLLLENTRRRWPFGFKGQLEMSNDPVDDLRFFDKRDDSHLATACGTTKRIHFIDLANHLGPALGRHIVWFLFNNRGRGECRGILAYLSSVGIRVETVITHHDLAFVRNMGNDSGDELQIVH